MVAAARHRGVKDDFVLRSIRSGVDVFFETTTLTVPAGATCPTPRTFGTRISSPAYESGTGIQALEQGRRRVEFFAERFEHGV